MDQTDFLEDPTAEPAAEPADDWADQPEYVEPIDLDGDRTADAAWGYLREVGQFALLDTDQDGRAEYIEVDTDGDGLVDATLEADGEEWILKVDLDQDGLVDQELRVTSAEIAAELPQLWGLLSGDLSVVDANPVVLPEPEAPGVPEVVDGQVVGDPFAYSDLWFQQAFDGSCLPASVAQIYSLYSGEVVTDLEFVQLANEVGGWVVDDEGIPGLRPEAAVELLERVGIDASIRTSDLDGLTTALDQGYAVMVAVDSGEIWTGEATEDDQMDHALLVAGIDQEAGVVYLSDTGTAEGNVMEVPLDVFLDSWQDSGNTMVVTDETIAEHRGEDLVEPVPAPVPAPEEQNVLQVPPGGLPEPVGDLTDLTDLTGDDDLPFEPFEAGQPTGVVDVLVRHPWILLPVALAGARLVSRPR